jgi:hypothetical protein
MAEPLWARSKVRPCVESASCKPLPGSDRLQVLDQIILFRVRESEGLRFVVVTDDVRERGKTSVVVEAARLVAPVP